MNKKIISIIFLFFAFSFLFLFLPDKADAADERPYCFSRDHYLCKKNLGSPPDKCCREKTCSSVCGSLNKWNYCYIIGCCAEYYDGKYYSGWYWTWKKIKCSVADTCKDDCYLYPGICSDSGCTVGGKYKICCKPDGSCCKCQGIENTGTCPSGC